MTDGAHLETPQPHINLLAEIAQLPQKEGVAERMEQIINSPNFGHEEDGRYVFPNLRDHHAGNETGSVATTNISENKPFYFSLLHTIFNRHQQSSIEKQKRLGALPGLESSGHIAQAIVDHRQDQPIPDLMKEAGIGLAEADFVDAIKDANRDYDLLRQLTRDHLTGLWTRPALEQMFQSLADLAETHDSPLKGFAILVLDIDDFKSINEKYGHDIGDIFLQQLKALRVDDTGYRIGGEEFVFLLPTFKDQNNLRNTQPLPSDRNTALESMRPRLEQIFTNMADTFHQFETQTAQGEVVTERTFCMGADFISTQELRDLSKAGKLNLKNVFKRADDVLRFAKRFYNKGTLKLATDQTLHAAEKYFKAQTIQDQEPTQ